MFLFCCIAKGAEDRPVEFARDIQAIFAEHCYACHGPSKRESNYRLDQRRTAIAGGDHGEAAIVPRDPDASPLWRYVAGHDPEMQMPPTGESKPLSSEQIATLRRWIELGAVWPDELAGDDAETITTDHWSFQPIQLPVPPACNDPRRKNGIDAFVFARLAAEGLEPSEREDSTILARRLFLDMHGLLPSEERLRSFLADDSPHAFDQLIDQVLDSSHYGERWARHWLDVVRFGESTGFEVNRDRENAWYYRDYVIGALNSDKSYRDFIIEQLAGDVVGNDVATGFLVGGPHDIVTSPDINLTLMQRQDELADYVNTTGTAFLGLTVGCARCHNHKFDPILQKDYYSMQAVFAGVQHGERELSNSQTDAAREQLEQTQRQLEALEAQLAKWKGGAPSDPESAGTLPAITFERNEEEFAAQSARFVRFTIQATTGAEPCIDELEVYSTENENIALAAAGSQPSTSGTLPGYAIHKLEHIHDGKYGNSHSWISNTAGGGWVTLKLAQVTDIHRIVWGRDRTGVVRDRLPTKYVIETSLDEQQWTTIASSSQRQPWEGGKEADDAFIARLPKEDAARASQVYAEMQQIRQRLVELRAAIPKAYVGTFKTPETIHTLYRGDPLAPREVVTPDALSVVGTLGLDNTVPEQQRRLALAEWIASSDNPLTARVIVNRVWHYHFGTGIVSTPSDLGKNGTLPSHPELLDWLAWQFMQKGWSLKWLHREILASHTYQQSSAPREEAISKDADSRLLWRFPPRRLAAEAIRDCVLQVSGALNHKAGGPGFLLFEIDHENVHHYFPKKSFGVEEFRRMIYMTKIRQEQDEVFGVFDCPDGAQVIPDRSRSTTPLQALNLLNSHFMLDQAAILASRVQQEVGPDATNQVRRLFRLAFSREPADEELHLALALIKQHGLAALCRAIFNANEFLFLSSLDTETWPNQFDLCEELA